MVSAVVSVPSSPTTPRLPLAAVGVGAVAAAGCVTVALADPNVPGRYPLCPFLAVTGLWCPVCGSTRALHALLNGAPAQALGFNALFVLALPLLVYAYLSWLSPRLPRLRLSRTAGWGMAVVGLAFGVLRNLPVGPLAALAP